MINTVAQECWVTTGIYGGLEWEVFQRTDIFRGEGGQNYCSLYYVLGGK